MKKILLIALVLLGGLGAWAFASRNGAENADSGQRYRTENASRGSIVASVSATGAVTATTTVIVSSQLSGQVVEVLVDHNDKVKAGQPLARLNRDTLLARRDSAAADLMNARATRRLNDAQAEKVKADLEKAKAQQQDMKAQVQRITALLADAETTFERQTSLKARGIASEVTLQAATTARETQAAAKLSAEAQLASSAAQIVGLAADAGVVDAQKSASEAQIAKQEAQVRQIEVDLANTEIRSPVDGVVVQRNVELGQTVAASMQAPTLFLVAQDLRRIEVYVNLDEADVGRVKAGQRVEFSVTAHQGRSFEGKVRLVRLGSQSVQNVVIYTTIVEVINQDMALLPGMTANLRIFTEEKPDVLRVPNSALRWQPPGAARTPVETAAAPGQEDPAGPFAERPQAGTGGGNPGRQMAVYLESLNRELSLNPAQARQLEGFGKTMRDAVMGAGSDPAARREAARAERQRFNRNIETVLTEEQKTAFRALRQRQQGDRRAGAGRNTTAGIPGRLHILDARGNPVAVSVRTGATDGTFSEIVSGDIKPGAALVVGNAAQGNKGARSGSAFRFGL